MKKKLLKTALVCMIAGAFLSTGLIAGTSVSTSKNNSNKNNELNKKAEPKKDKSTDVVWIGTVAVSKDTSGKSSATFTNDTDSQQYNVQMDDATEKLLAAALASVKPNSKSQIKGTLVEKADGKKILKITECKSAPTDTGKQKPS